MNLTIKPAASCKNHLLAAAMLWSIVGIFLASRGIWNILDMADFSWWWIAAAAVMGIFKGKTVFVPSAKKSVNRITARGDGKCIGGFISARNWLLVIAMILLGKLLRAAPIHKGLVWSIYVAVGFALLVSSVVFWRAWARHNHDMGE